MKNGVDLEERQEDDAAGERIGQPGGLVVAADADRSQAVQRQRADGDTDGAGTRDLSGDASSANDPLMELE